ncbi:hypothetical protein JOF42_002436 [Microbacterium phyllosphaerae]|uniref:DUF4062 domain-containing protein n=1 Tax=Microbacterium phyllosphaerae TaxID=124798 RepID=A0ABS4WSA9_9MICO|nr:DUF4062 domain-containing protein [Microbacterium phyllosphaerae]MBP2378941.1 hypothetical protein [Microbacterium phyllosphaerae]
MDKRYQVFVSSTFTDLIDERREVMQALLEMDSVPAGMELFPAGNDDQWTLIKGVIEQSDYYLVILAGRYGSVTEEGLSFTEKEYDYAVELGLPVLGFVAADVDSIPVGKTDRNDAAAAKLDAFRAKVQKRMTKDWKNAEDLGSKVTRGLMHLFKTHPRPGWVRGDQAMTSETRIRIAELEAKIATLEMQEIENQNANERRLDTDFAHGSERMEISIHHSGFDAYGTGEEEEDGTLACTWDEIVEVLGPFMIDEAPEPALQRRLEKYLVTKLLEDSDGGWTLGWEDHEVSVSDSSWGSIIVQLRALRVITIGTRPRGINDRNVYWKLTPAGDDYVVSLRATPSESLGATR